MKSGTFVPDERLRPRDNSGGPMGPHKSTDFGEAGKSVGGESMNTRGNEDEMKMPARGNKRGMMGGY